MAPSASSGRSVLSPLRVGESVARELRERILTGEYVDTLPKQEALMADFEVSAPSIREAFRVLEAEGLIVVRRGNVGGATIRLPNADDTAYALGLALQAKSVRVSEVAAALWSIEPAVARLCAEFQHYIIITRSLQKVFLSIKGTNQPLRAAATTPAPRFSVSALRTNRFCR